MVLVALPSRLSHPANKMGQVVLHGKGMQWLWGRAMALGLRPLQRTLFGQFFWGRDVFISYSHSGAEPYAKSLANLFRRQSFYPFLAGDESKPSRLERPTLERWLKRALSRSTILVLIGEPLAFKSQWVAWEVTTFEDIRRDALLITVSIGNALQDIDLSGTPFQALRDRVYLSEDAEALHRGQPSLRIVDEVRKSLTARGRAKRRKILFQLALAWVLVLLALAFLVGLLVGKRLS
jgi:MTH538 TIR-like domain (DUF1863)